MMHIKLSNSELYFVVDDEDYERVRQEKWYLFGTGNQICCYWGKIPVKIANFLMRDLKGMYDHKDIDFKNNQKSNLRPCSHSQNMMNRAKQKNTLSEYKGVSYRKDRGAWYAYIRLNKKLKHLGVFKSEVEAAQAYNVAATKYFGEFAKINTFR